LKAKGAKSVEELYTKVFEDIRKNCDRVKRAAKANPKRDH
jgi:large subunit ribosomal protein L5e